MIAITLELTSFGTDEIGSVRKIDQGEAGLRLIVTLPPIIDDEQANLTAALLLQQLERLPDNSIIDRVKMVGLHFTSTSVVGIQGFLSAQAATVKHVSIKGMIASNDPDDAEAFQTLASAFNVSSLETLNLSDNYIDGGLWQCWSMHRNLRQLILDYVEIPDESLVEFANHFTFGENLMELYVVLTNSITRTGQKAANAILRACRKLSSLRWAEKDAPSTALLPWNGLYDLACGLNHSALVHLVMDGGTITQEELGDEGLCGAVSRLDKLRTLKLRGIGLSDEGVQSLVKAIRLASPPLETIDLCKNKIKTLGSVAISKLSGVEAISRSLVLLNLDRNSIEIGGAREILESFATANTRLEIKFDANPLNFGKLAFNLARRKAQADMEREEMRSASQLGSGKDIKHMEDEIRKLREEKASLLKVLSIVNSQNGASEMERTLDRISNLEKTVLGGSSNNNMKFSSSATSRISDIPLGRLLDRANSSRDMGRYSNDSVFSNPFSSPTKKSSPRISAPTHASTPSPSRRSSASSTQQSQARNSLIRGMSERWSSPKHGKKKATTMSQASPSPSPSPKNGKFLYPHLAKAPAAKLDLDSWDRTNHSSTSASSQNQHSWENSAQH